MGTRGLHIVRYRGRYYIYYHQFDSYPEGWPTKLVNSIPKDRAVYEEWLSAQRAEYEQHDSFFDAITSVLPIEPESEDDDTKKRQISTSADCARAPDAEYFRGKDWCSMPGYATRFNDLDIEGIYTIDLDREIFSVDNQVHFRLDQVSRVDWLSVFSTRDEDGNRIRNLEAVPQSALGMIARPQKPLKPNAITHFLNLKATKVESKGLAGFAPSQRHGVLLCATLFQRWRRDVMPTAEHLIGSWTVNDKMFREYAFIVLCLASLSCNVDMEFSEDMKGESRLGYYDFVVGPDEHKTSEFVALPDFGAHLDGSLAPPWPTDSTFELEGAVIRLVPDLEDSDGRLEEELLSLHEHCTTMYPNASTDAILFSVASVVLVKIKANGTMKHTDILPIFDLTCDPTINEGMERSDYDPLMPYQEDLGPMGKAPGSEPPKQMTSEVKLMGLFNQMMFGPDTDENSRSVAAGFRELQEETGTSRIANSGTEAAVVGESETVGSHADTHEGDGDSAASDHENRQEAKDGEVASGGKGEHEADAGEAVSGKKGSEVPTESLPAHAPVATTITDEAGRNHRPGTSGQETATIEGGDDGRINQPSTLDKDVTPTESSEEECNDQPKSKGKESAPMTRHDEERNGQSELNNDEIADKDENGSDNESQASSSPTMTNTGFYALSHFFSSVARKRLASFRHAPSPKMPLEAYRLIISHVTDHRTFRACMNTSLLFRDLCMERPLFSTNYVLLANDASRGDVDAAARMVEEERLVCNLYDREEEEAEELVVGTLHRSMFSNNGGGEEYWMAVLGNEEHKRMALPSTALVWRKKEEWRKNTFEVRLLSYRNI
ncbi:uncharacterized protein KY384_006239 [Bacidia gigantensis]|uniref:uncharacterized protein n=1 Tax=Bacidia gigantensis TaxID=2732470 RepID=UPI001D05BBCD|nr:uncharacterized protein KY384_006239 [Bacidia gigantensis]KAG8529602.1 hypothetical protein KY384_006239 [Bacidia gigantensis]